MKGRKILIIAIIAVFVAICIAICILIPEIFFYGQKRVFSEFSPTEEIDDYDLSYYARYEMTTLEWQEVQKKLTDYRVVTVNGSDDLNIGEMASFVGRLFTDEEIENMTPVYFRSRYIGIPFFNRRLTESCVAVCIDGDSAFVYYSIGVMGRNAK